ncbi:MAG: PAS domain S-box protein [Candidatus Binataceae bacterium]|nr:PAS domain S-box protein [Candidatus Binataceae bacterium]
MTRWLRLRSVRTKLLAGVLLTTVSALLVATGALMVFDLRSYQDVLSNDMRTQAELIGRASAAALNFDDPKAAAANLGLLQVRPRVRAAAIYNAKGAFFASYVRGGGHFDFPKLPDSAGLATSGDTMTIFERIVANGEILGSVYLVADYGLYRRVARYAVIALGVTAAALVLSLLLSLWLQRMLTQPIQEISDLARHVVDRRDYSVRAKKMSDDEIGYLVEAFNDMLAEIEHRTSAMAEANQQLQREMAERERADRALRESEARYRSLVEGTAQIIWVADERGMIAGPAPSWQAYTGQSDAEVQGEGWAKALHPDDAGPALQAWRSAIEAQSVFEYEYRIRSRNGAYRWFSVRGVPVRREDGTIREWVRICSDIDDRRRAEEEIRRLNETLEVKVRERTAQLEETNRELEAFSYSVSHDLRAPVRAVDGFSQALIEDYADRADEGMRRYLDRIRSATQHMGQLIDDLLNLSRISRVELNKLEVDLSTIVRQVAKSLQQREPERKVDVMIWDDVAANGDPRLLRVVFENLLGNAWKFTSKTEQANIEFGVLHEAQRTVYFVRDNGAGFDMAHAEKLFGAFHRLHAVSEFPGTGIGLATVQRVIHRHGGRIWAHAQPGKGATLYFTLASGAASAMGREHEV